MRKSIVYIFTGVLVILLWNVALVKRDTELMKAYDEAHNDNHRN